MWFVAEFYQTGSVFSKKKVYRVKNDVFDNMEHV